MNFPSDCRYTKEHEWVRVDADNVVYVGVTDFAQSELGDIVFIDIDSAGQKLDVDAIFGTVEAVKTVSDLFLPISGTVLEINPKLDSEPELVNNDPYGDGWMIKLEVDNIADLEKLMDVDTYKNLIGQ